MTEVLPIRVQKCRYCVRVHPRSERADVQLVHRADCRQEAGCAWPDSGMVPRGSGAVQLEVINVLNKKVVLTNWIDPLS